MNTEDDQIVKVRKQNYLVIAMCKCRADSPGIKNGGLKTIGINKKWQKICNYNIMS